MESLGLQTVTLSDGTTAYVQQAVKGEYFREPQNPACPPDPGEDCPLPRVSLRPCPPTCSPQLALQKNLSLMKMGLFKIKCHLGRLENQISPAVGVKTSERQSSLHVTSGL